MKRPCPDLLAMEDQQLRDFWKVQRPENFKRLGDRLLAESLPRFPPREASFYLSDLGQLRTAANLSLEQLSQRLGVSSSILKAWEEGEVRPPASLSLIYQALR
jgi:DNA-binding XRE family transcriptional regulator